MDDDHESDFFDSEEKKHFHLVIQTFLNYELVLTFFSFALLFKFFLNFI